MQSQNKLLARMLAQALSGMVVLGALLFGSAGSWHYVNAWLLIGALTLLMLGLGLLLLVRHPEMLAKRLNAKESQTVQKGYIAAMGGLFVLSFVLAGLDFRFEWSRMPLGWALVALAVMVLGYGLFAAVMLQNAYAARTVAVQENQQVISTGLYALVRHPMYLACLLLFLAMPLALGSYVALLPMLLFPAALVLRLKNEEAVLKEGLPGYAQYMQKTKYRLIPYIW